MPAAEDLIPDLDTLERKPAPAAETSITSAIGSWPTKKNKKKSKKNAAVKPPKAWDEEEETQRPQSITPPEVEIAAHQQTSPPAAASPPAEDAQTRLPSSFSPAPIEWEDETTANEDTESEARPHSPVRSPPIQPAKLHSPPTSPPNRPATLHNGGPHNYPSSQTRRLSSTQPVHHNQRRESFGMVQPPPQQARPRYVDPPPPHMPQSHFFGLPDIGLNFGQKQEQGKPAGSDGCCRFDSFDDAGHAPSARKARDALLVGSEGGLDVYRVLPDKMEVVGRLEGLRGAVVDAKILPNFKGKDDQSTWPLIAVIVHGLMDEGKIKSGQDDEFTQEPPGYYQTSVELYSLQKQEHIATLYKSVPMVIDPPTLGTLSLPPKPIGDLHLDAAGNFLALASGKSGEIFVFSNARSSSDPARNLSFSCIGKFWTSLQTRIDVKKQPGAKEPVSTLPTAEQRRRTPIFSLSHRWLAVVPPYTSAGISIQGSPLTDHQTPSEVSLNMAPIQPFITCEVAGIDAEGTLSWLSRKAAQGFLNASQKGYELGMQGWKELTQPAPIDRSGNHASPKDQEVFPPTNGPSDDPKRHTKEPALISFIDLQALVPTGDEPQPLLPPLATFALVDGCNHLSFSPDGLRLLTANRKGETTTVWDLRNIAHGKAKLGSMESESERGPHVKPLHRITRSSPSIILDSVWSRDGDWLAVLTGNGTVHLHEIPLRSPYQKKKRRSTISAPATARDKAEPTVGVSAEGMSPPSSNGFWGTFKSGLQSVSTQVGAIRSTSTASPNFPLPTTFAGFREVTTAARTAGGRAVARGISQGYSAAKGGASDIWHAEDNKIRHKQLHSLQLQDLNVPKSTLRWIERQGTVALAVVCGGSVHLHAVQRITRRKGDVTVTGLKHERHAQKTFALPRLNAPKPNGNNVNGAIKPNSCANEGPHGFWSLRQTNIPTSNNKQTFGSLGSEAGVTKINAMALHQSIDEVETNPPYCPFHIDSRINIYAFTEDTSQILLTNNGTSTLDLWMSRGHAASNADAKRNKKADAWLFGDPLPQSIKMNDGALSEDDLTQSFATPTKPSQHDIEGGDGSLPQDYSEDEDDAAEHLMQSRLTVHPAPAGLGSAGRERMEQVISVSTSRREPRSGGRKSRRQRQAQGEGQVVDDDSDEFGFAQRCKLENEEGDLM